MNRLVWPAVEALLRYHLPFIQAAYGADPDEVPVSEGLYEKNVSVVRAKDVFDYVNAGTFSPAPPCPLVAFSGRAFSRAAQITIDFRGTSCPTATDNGVPLHAHGGQPLCTEEDGAAFRPFPIHEAPRPEVSFRLGSFPFGGEFTITTTMRGGFGTLIAFAEAFNLRMLRLAFHGWGLRVGITLNNYEVYDDDELGSTFSNGGGSSDLPNVGPYLEHTYYVNRTERKKQVCWTDLDK